MKEESPPHGGVRGVTIDGSGRDENYGMEHTRSRMVLIVLDGFAGVSALIGMAMLLTDWPVHFPVGWLQHTPFSNYTLPALILGLIVGGSALVAMATVISRASVGAVLSLIAGAIMIGWIVGEVLLIDSVTPSSAYWLQAEYLLVGVAMVALALRVAPGGWRGMVHRFLHRQQRAMGAMAHR